MLGYDPAEAGTGEKILLGGLKTKNVDVVVTNPYLGPVLAVSCKGATKAFRNLSNRMEETIGECTNLHITYPALVLGYLAVLRANRTVQDALEAPDTEDNSFTTEEGDEPASVEADVNELVDGGGADESKAIERVKANDIAVENGKPVEGILRFHAALREMTLRHGVRDEISRYEAMTIALVEPRGALAGGVFEGFPDSNSPLHLSRFFPTLYQRYDERFVYGASLLAERGITPRIEWAPESEIFARTTEAARDWPGLDFTPRVLAL
jgi:hypothetical protein